MGLHNGSGFFGFVPVCPTGLGDRCRSFFLKYEFAQRARQSWLSTGVPNGSGGWVSEFLFLNGSGRVRF